MAKKKKNWDIIRDQKDTDTVKYRDVYEDQQLERGSIAKKQSMTSRIILATIVSVFVGVAVWAVTSMVQMFTDRAGLDDDLDPSDDYVYVDKYYYNAKSNDGVFVSGPNGKRVDTLSVEEYEEWYKIYHDYDNQRKPDDTWTKAIPVDDMKEYAASFSYNSSDNTYKSSDGVFTSSEYQAMLKKHESEYKKAKAEYDLFVKRHTDPEYHEPKNENDAVSGYKSIVAHYRSVSNPSEFISEDKYKQMLADYEANLKTGNISDDIKDIPLMPVDPSKIYSPVDYTYLSNHEIWAKTNGSVPSVIKDISKDELTAFVSKCKDEYNISDLTKDPYNGYDASSVDSTDAKAVAKYNKYLTFFNDLKSFLNTNASYSECWSLFEECCNMLHYDRTKNKFEVETDMKVHPQNYRNNFDGSVISCEKYNEMCNKYQQDYDTYAATYKTHRTTYHKDDINGDATNFTMAPNLVKMVISFIFAGIAFSVLYMILSKNLKAQNIMSDTTDINQYHNDQHVALPEEVQKNYDWFPDVGAHSSVQVSSMISHMAITNKGLKNVTMAKRAKENIKDKNGDIEYYKGEILLDDDGNPKTYQAPIIDTDFMEALFDASGAPKSKDVRHYYDTTKIPYNPGNTNRDKLSGYDTVADLINKDWDFPLYEPQRPGGAYIVDTAPVNTIKYAYYVTNA